MARHGLAQSWSYSYGLFYDDPVVVPGAACRYEACVQVPDGYETLSNDGIAFQIVPGGAFARSRYVGPWQGVGERAMDMRNAWLAKPSNLQFDATRPFMVIYLGGPARGPGVGKQRFDVCVPVSFASGEGETPFTGSVSQAA
jgi:AraC family transcriptional regulator